MKGIVQILARVANAETSAIECRRGAVLARVRSEAVFARNAANVARRNSLACTNVLGRPGSKLSHQLGIERTEIFCLYWPH